MNERFKIIREHLKLTQKEFSEKIGFAQTSYSQIENGVRNVTERIIKLICQEFNVNEEWLRYGIGDMFSIKPENIIEELEKKFEMGDVFKKAVITYLKANESTRKAIDDYLYEVFKATNNT